MTENQSALKAIRIFECLTQDGFAGMTLNEISKTLSMPTSTAWRLLKTLECAGWVFEAPLAGSKEGLWKVSDKLVGIAFQYKRHALGTVQDIESQYITLAGEQLR